MKWRPSTTFSLILVFALLAVFALWLSFRVANTAMLAMVDQRELASDRGGQFQQRMRLGRQLC